MAGFDIQQQAPTAHADDELSVEELEEVAGGLGDNTNCTESCTSNTNCDRAATT